MKISIQFVQMQASETLMDFSKKKLNKLGKKYDWLIHAEVFFKKENDSKGKGKVCEIELSLPGPRIYASSNEESFELALVNTISDIDKQLKKRKGELKTYL